MPGRVGAGRLLPAGGGDRIAAFEGLPPSREPAAVHCERCERCGVALDDEVCCSVIACPSIAGQRHAATIGALRDLSTPTRRERMVWELARENDRSRPAWSDCG